MTDLSGVFDGDPVEAEDLPDEDIVERAHKAYKDSQQHQSRWRPAAHMAYDFYVGDQWDEDDRRRMKDEDRPVVAFNRTGVVIDSIIGLEVNNRQEVRYIPRTQGDTKANEVLSGAAMWVRDECDAEDEETDAFSDMLITGMGWTETRIDYTQDPDGKILIERTDPLEMYWDPAARKKNLVDSRWRMRIKGVDRDEAIAQWPQLRDIDIDDAGAPWDGLGDDSERDFQEHVYPQDAYRVNRSRQQDRNKGKIKVAQLQWWEIEDVYRVGEEFVPADKFEVLRERLDMEGIDYVRQKKRVYKQAFVTGLTLLESGESPGGDNFTLQCMTGKRDHNNNIWYGLVKNMLDPQRWANKFFSTILHILNTNSKGGIMAEADAVDDPRKLEETWARPDGVTWVTPGAVSQGKIMPKPVAQYPSGLDRLMEFSVSSIRDVSGVNLEMLGLADRQQAGVLEYQRRQSGLAILAPMFDAMRRYRKDQGSVLLHYIQNYISDGRLIRVTQDNGEEGFQPLYKNEDTAKFDVIVDQSPTSPNQKEKVFAALVQMMPSLAGMGIQLPPELLDYSPLPTALAAKWKESLQKGNQIPPEMQAQMQMMAEENKSLKSKREEKMAELQLKREESQAELELEREKWSGEFDLAREKAAGELQLKAVQTGAGVAAQVAKIRAAGNGQTRSES